jgi:DNA-binding beta-propeller fold protein YncE
MRIQMRDAQGSWSVIARYEDLLALAADTAGNLYVADGYGRIQKLDGQGNWSVIATTGTALGQVRYLWALAVDPAGKLYVADTDGSYGSGRIQKRDAQGNWSVIATQGTALGQVGYVGGLAVDGAGNLFIADTFNNRVRKLGVAGSISTVAGNGVADCGTGSTATTSPLARPYGVVLDGSGNLYVGHLCDAIVRVTPAGSIQLFAGIYETGFSGDGGPATAALMNGTSGLAIDGAGVVYVAD